MRFPFDLVRATEATAFLLSLHGGPLSRFHVIKLLYLADRESFERYGHPIVGGRYVSMDHGPVLSEVLDLTKAEESEEPRGVWAKHIRKTGERDCELVEELRPAKLSRADIEILRSVHGQFGGMTFHELYQAVHLLPEWTDPNGTVIDIDTAGLLRLLGKTDQEIAVIAEDTRAAGFYDELFSE